MIGIIIMFFAYLMVGAMLVLWTIMWCYKEPPCIVVILSGILFWPIWVPYIWVT